MEKLVDGIHQFQQTIFGSQKRLFQRLVDGQHPLALFITCSDSRIDPNLLTQTDPGELFIMRNAGNIVPAYGAAGRRGGHDRVCRGRAEGQRHHRLRPFALRRHEQPVASRHGRRACRPYRIGCEHAEATARIIKENYAHLTDHKQRLTATVEENVLVQLENLRTHPGRGRGVGRGDLKLHGWVYKFETGEVFAYDPQRGQFAPIEQVDRQPGASQPVATFDVTRPATRHPSAQPRSVHTMSITIAFSHHRAAPARGRPRSRSRIGFDRRVSRGVAALDGDRDRLRYACGRWINHSHRRRHGRRRLAGCPLQVSGPAAGLTVIVFEIVQKIRTGNARPVGTDRRAGLQLPPGLMRLGQWFRAVSPAVIKGMLAGIGVLILASQFHVMVDDNPRVTACDNLSAIPAPSPRASRYRTCNSREVREAHSNARSGTNRRTAPATADPASANCVAEAHRTGEAEDKPTRRENRTLEQILAAQQRQLTSELASNRDRLNEFEGRSARMKVRGEFSAANDRRWSGTAGSAVEMIGGRRTQQARPSTAEPGDRIGANCCGV